MASAEGPSARGLGVIGRLRRLLGSRRGGAQGERVEEAAAVGPSPGAGPMEDSPGAGPTEDSPGAGPTEDSPGAGPTADSQGAPPEDSPGAPAVDEPSRRLEDARRRLKASSPEGGAESGPD